MVNTRSTKYNEETTTMDGDRRTNDDDKRTVRRQNDDDKRTVKRQKGERKSDERRTNDDGRRTVRRQNDDDKRTVREAEKRDEKRRQEDRDEAERRHQEICESQKVINTRLNEFSGRIDGVEQQIDQVGLKFNRIEKEFQENKEEIERKLEDTRRRVQKEILEKINGLEHQLHRASIADSGDCLTSPATPLQHSSLMHTERSVHKMLKPPTYDGQSSWSMYRRQFEAAAKANGWTPQEMATSLVISLRGQALEILQSIPEEQQNDYNRIVGALEIRYGHKYLRQVYQSQIKSRQQRSNESLQEYEADIERLVHLAYPQAPKEFLEQIGIQTFIDGLVDTEMQQALRLGRHTTISDALVAALEFKAAKEASRSYKSRDWSFPNPRPKTSFQITSKKFGKRQLVDARGRVSTTYTQCPKIYVSKISSDERSLIVHGYLDDKWCSFVIDTGATRTILRPDILQKSSKELSRHVKLETATGELIPVEDEWSSEELKKSQKKDSDLKLIRNWVKNGVRPTWQEVSRYGTTIKGYWAQWSSLCLRDGLLHRKWESPDGVSAVYQLVLPKARIHQVLEELHSSPSGGHFGVTRTLARDLRKRMDRIHRFAREKLKIHSDKMKQRLDTTSTETAFKPGDAVWLYAPKRTKGKSPKLQSNWEGPYTIIKKINDLVYRIQLSPRSKPKVVHLERLAKYTGHNPPDWFVVEDPPPRTEDSVIRDE
ncbi:hypothetical protein NQ318_018007 [Aromia moschata]|uniref:Integrase p58-like C-terminal domain-containing protein n=1 Tax=Aromia moschata TaxID=1265417 RepID=A0AAV8YB89_9CUCU|nr:hypothetical protein NQ318_018007 [Aromia moschata]